jgi:hypothetical protein
MHPYQQLLFKLLRVYDGMKRERLQSHHSHPLFVPNHTILSLFPLSSRLLLLVQHVVDQDALVQKIVNHALLPLLGTERGRVGGQAV